MKKYRLSIAQTTPGFSLLELLFVVAILATVATFGLSIYRQRTVNVKITRAAAEIQQILQAGSAFYADNREWPVGQSQTGEEFEKNYLPFGKTRKSPWDENYAYKPLSETGDVKKARLFQVETLVPTENAASQMAAQLPNAEIEKSDGVYKVKSQVAVPGQDKAVGGSYMIVEIGEIGNGKPGTDQRSRYLNAPIDGYNRSRRVDFDCPGDMEKGLFVTFEGIRSGPEKLLTALASFEISQATKCDKAGCEIRVDLNYWGEKDSSEFRCINPGCWIKGSTAKVQYIAYCTDEKTK